MTLLVGLTALAVSVGLTLAHASPRLAGSDDVEATALLRELPPHGGRLCQNGETLPRGTAALRLSLQSETGPPIGVVALAKGRRVAGGQRAPGWGGSSVTVPLSTPPRRDVPLRICIDVGASGEHVDVLGATASGRIRIDDLRAGPESWWSLAPAIVTRLGRGHAWSGPSVAIVAGALMLAAIGLALRQLARVEGGEEP
jgi:hypothetical protein